MVRNTAPLGSFSLMPGDYREFWRSAARKQMGGFIDMEARDSVELSDDRRGSV
jgi:hypothetical protein